MMGLKYIGLFVLALILTAILIPMVFWLELALVPSYSRGLQTSVELGLGDALTIASVLGAVGVFVLERYWAATHREQDRRAGGALRLIMEHVGRQTDTATIEEHWTLFQEDEEGRNLCCGGDFAEISLDDFTAKVYALQFEGKVDLTPGNQIVRRLPFSYKVRSLDLPDKDRIIALLDTLATQGDDEFVRAEAINALAEMRDGAVIPVMQRYLGDSNPRVRLAAAKTLIQLVAFPEQ